MVCVRYPGKGHTRFLEVRDRPVGALCKTVLVFCGAEGDPSH